jgi:flagellar operon protein
MGNEQSLLRLLEPAVRPAGSPAPTSASRSRPPIDQRSFNEMLASLADRPLKLSASAQQALSDRGLNLSDEQLNALATATDRAELKGSRDALILMNQLGVIVNVPNRTVLTVLPPDRMTDGIVTQIDSAVMVPDPAANTPTRHRLNL